MNGEPRPNEQLRLRLAGHTFLFITGEFYGENLDVKEIRFHHEWYSSGNLHSESWVCRTARMVVWSRYEMETAEIQRGPRAQHSAGENSDSHAF